MPAQNTATSFGSVTRTLHWLTALLILTAIPLGLIANQLPADAASMATKVQLFSIHKTLGLAAFLIGLARILWALTQRHPAPLHPDRRAELRLAAAIHWLLYISLVAVPLTGWIHHAALAGFAPILWPFGQDLPFVAKSETTAAIFGAAHWVFTKLLAASILLHIAGALKHHFIDKDATLRRMLAGASAPATPKHPARGKAPLAAALLAYLAGAGLTYAMLPPAPETATAEPAATTRGNWSVTEGTLGFSIKQMGAAVEGSFASWTAAITFNESASNGKHGQVTVTIDTTSLSLGSVTDQAKGPEFFDTAAHKTATFTADILPSPTGYTAEGNLTLHGISHPVALPFTLQITGDTATMTGTTSLDRRDFGIGAGYADEETVGFTATITVALTAKRS
ncbi:MAG: putative cytochrome B561 [Rhodobacteraceae bacterium]|uniref:cytochrome b/b6 domain-containing protein n=1 Tax=Cypionkella sp. TaxID=2811411 RepID=UPI001320B43B|nr:cytochrome b/b6 domain-containing protein [Cypionkella sp.]KAF0171427.1 MAG: putative cytochrome B561 [Paracoccaceae bacterium]MDO8325345.1 cytochrome b/b6 domain-containing protein [Cypionkella sp.]